LPPAGATKRCGALNPEIPLQTPPHLEFHPRVLKHALVVGIVQLVLGIGTFVVAATFLVRLEVREAVVLPHEEVPICLLAGDLLDEVAQTLPLEPPRVFRRVLYVSPATITGAC